MMLLDAFYFNKRMEKLQKVDISCTLNKERKAPDTKTSLLDRVYSNISDY